MVKQIGLSGVAVAVLLLAVTPAAAVSINLGGSGGLLSTGSGSSDGNTSVNVNTGDNDLLGSSDADGDITLLEGDDDANANLRLFGAPGNTRTNGTAAVNLGDENEDDVFLDLFGSPTGGSNTASANLFGGGAGNGGNDAALNLFGAPGGSNGNGTDPTQTGSTNGSGGNSGEDLFGPGGNGVQPVPPAINGASRVRVATIGPVGGNCFSPDPGQIDNLLARTNYSMSQTSNWKSADNVNVVPINLCPDARTKVSEALEANANIEFLHSAVAGDAKISGALNPNYDPDDVLAVDQSGEDLTVYVY